MTDQDVIILKDIPNDAPVKEFEAPLYKQWFKTATRGGFLSITPFVPERDFVGRFIIDIGSVDPKTSKVEGATACYVDALELHTYLQAVIRGQGLNVSTLLYPKRSGTFSPESFVSYGGSAKGEPVARVFKTEWWGAGKDSEGDPSAFVWKCGHFKGIVQGTGAIKPDTSAPIQNNSIKVTRLALNEIAHRIDIFLHGHAALHSHWYVNG